MTEVTPQVVHFTDDDKHNRIEIDKITADLGKREPGRTFSVSHTIEIEQVKLKLSLAPFINPSDANYDLGEIPLPKYEDIPLDYIYELVRTDLENLFDQER